MDLAAVRVKLAPPFNARVCTKDYVHTFTHAYNILIQLTPTDGGEACTTNTHSAATKATPTLCTSHGTTSAVVRVSL